MHDVLEEHAHHHEEEPWTLPVAITISILAVLTAMATLMGHRSGIEAVLQPAIETVFGNTWRLVIGSMLAFIRDVNLSLAAVRLELRQD